jgi:hypothetical protein
MRILVSILFIFSWTLPGAGLAHGESGAIELRLTLDKSEYNLGEPILARLTITNLGKEQIFIPKEFVVKTNYRIEKLSQEINPKKYPYPVSASGDHSPAPKDYYPGKAFELNDKRGIPNQNKYGYVLLNPGQKYRGDSLNVSYDAHQILKPGYWKVWIKNYYAPDVNLKHRSFCGWVESNPVNFSIRPSFSAKRVEIF